MPQVHPFTNAPRRARAARVLLAVIVGVASLVAVRTPVSDAHYADPGLNNAQLNIPHETSLVFIAGSFAAQTTVEGKSFLATTVAHLFQCLEKATDLDNKCQRLGAVPTLVDGTFVTAVNITGTMVDPSGATTDCWAKQCAVAAATFDDAGVITSHAEHNICFAGVSKCSWGETSSSTSTSSTSTTSTSTTSTTTTLPPPPPAECTLREEAVRHHGDPSDRAPWPAEMGSNSVAHTDLVWRKEPLLDASPRAREAAAMAYDPTKGRTLLFGGFSSTSPCVMDDTWSWDGTRWTLLNPTTRPPARYGHVMAFDGNQIMLFGGYDGGDDWDDTWTWDWDRTTWVSHSDLDPVPSPRARASAAYDGERRQVVMFGGDHAGHVLGDTWTWDGSAWTRRTPPDSPPARGFASMAYYPPSKQVLLHGGWHEVGLIDTWAWNGDTWVYTSRVGPQLHSAAMSRHPATGLVVAVPGTYLGVNARPEAAADGAAWDGIGWAGFAEAADSLVTLPPSRRFPAMAEDSQGRLIFFGGFGRETRPPFPPQKQCPTSPIKHQLDEAGVETDLDPMCTEVEVPGVEAQWGDTWMLATPGTGASPSPGLRVDVTLDRPAIPADGKSATLVTVSVTRAGAPLPGHAVEIDTDGDTTIGAPRGRTGPDGIYTTVITASTTPSYETITAHVADVEDPLFSGQFLPDSEGTAILTEEGIVLTLEPPSLPPDGTSTSVARAHLIQAAGLAGERVCFSTDGDVTFSPAGPEHCGVRGDFDTWTVTITASLTGGEERITATAATSRITGSAVLFEGGQQWLEQLPSVTGPSPQARDGAVMAYDPDNKVTVLFGGYDGINLTALDDTWLWTGGRWEELKDAAGNPIAGPSPRWGHSMAYDASSGDVLLFGGWGNDRYLGDTWTFDAGSRTWSLQQPVTAPSARYMANMAPDGAGVLLFSGTDGFASDNFGPTPPDGPGHLADTWTWRDGAWTERHSLPSAQENAPASSAFTSSTPIVVPLPPPPPGCPAPKGCPADKADPYPSSIPVSGLTGTVANVTVTLHDLAHTLTGPADLDIMLVAPNGEGVMLMSDACGTADSPNPITNPIDLTFDDSGPALPSAGPCTSGTFRPTNVVTEENTPAHKQDAFSAPAPPNTRSASLGYFRGVDPNGNWSLYVVDDGPNDPNPVGEAGRIGGGWSLTVTAGNPMNEAGARTSPPGRGRAAIAYHPPTGKVVMYGGSAEYQFAGSLSGTPTGGSLNGLADTWTWDGGRWAQIGSGANPGPLHSATMTYHPSTRQLLLFGGSLDRYARIGSQGEKGNVVEPLDGTWTWNGDGWAPQAQSIRPPSRMAAASAEDAAGRVVVLGGLIPSDRSDRNNESRGDTWAWDARVDLRLERSALAADGSDHTLAVATITDASGRPVAGLAPVRFSTDGDTMLSDATDRGDGSYVATVRASTNGGIETITVRTPSGSASTTLEEVDARCAPAPTSTRPGTWEPVKPIPRPVISPAAAAGGNGHIYTFGGTGAGGTLSLVQDYNPCTNSWRTLPSMPGGRRMYAAAATAPDGRIFVVGGAFEGAALAASDSVEVYTPGSGSIPGRWQTFAPINTARYQAATAFDGAGNLFVMGGIRAFGMYLDPNATVDLVEVYSPATSTWRTSPPMSVTRAGAGASGLPGGEVLAIGGEAQAASASGTNNTTESYSHDGIPEAGTWAPASPMGTPRAYFGAALGSDGLIYATGGAAHAALAYHARQLDTVEALDSCTQAWVPVPSMPMTRAEHSAVTGPDGRLYVIGGFGGSATSTPSYVVIFENPGAEPPDMATDVFAYRPDPATRSCSRAGVNDVSVAEARTGATTAPFTVSLDRPAPQPLTVNYRTRDGSAVAGYDYESRSGSVTFLPGEQRKVVEVSVMGGAVPEPDEQFFLDLSTITPEPVPVSLTRATGAATIADAGGDDEEPPPPGPVALSAADQTVAEPYSGGVPARFSITLNKAAPERVTFDYATADGTAIAGDDYAAVVGTGEIRPGFTTAEITVPILGDTAPEDTEDFSVLVTHVRGATTGDGVATGRITDARAGASVGDAEVFEGDNGTVEANFTMTLAAASGQPVTIDYTTAAETATSPSDFGALSGRLVFESGEQSRVVSVGVVGDSVPEATETFALRLTRVEGAVLSDGEGTGTILDDDSAPSGSSPPGPSLPASVPAVVPALARQTDPSPPPPLGPPSPGQPLRPAPVRPGNLSQGPPHQQASQQASQQQASQQPQTQQQVQQQAQQQIQAQAQAQAQSQAQSQAALISERQRERAVERANTMSSGEAQTYLATAHRRTTGAPATLLTWMAALVAAAGFGLGRELSARPSPSVSVQARRNAPRARKRYQEPRR